MIGRKDAESSAQSLTLLSVRGDHAKIDGKFTIADSLEIQCEIGGELTVGGKLVIGEHGIVKADVRTVDAVIMGTYQGTMVATGNVEITETGRVTGNITTDSLVISKGGFFNGNVTKMAESDAAKPVYLVEEGGKRRLESKVPAGQPQARSS